jgi:hypothetical protein
MFVPVVLRELGVWVVFYGFKMMIFVLWIVLICGIGYIRSI